MPGNPSKQELKSAIVQQYETLFTPIKEGESLLLTFDETFWGSFFSITPKISILEWKFLKSTQDLPFSSLRPNLILLFNKCVDTLPLWYQVEEKSRHTKVLHALHTLAGFFRVILKKSKCEEEKESLLLRFLNFGGVDNRIKSIYTHICNFLSLDESPYILKDICLTLLLIFATGGSNVAITGSPTNKFIISGKEEKLFKVLVHLLNDDETKEEHRTTSVLLLTILVQYRKHESENSFAVQLSLLDEEVALSAYSRIINSSLSEFVKVVEKMASNSEGWLTYLVSSMFVSENKGFGGFSELLSSRSYALLAMYEAIHLNRNFIANLTHYSNGSVNDTSPSNLLVTFLEFCSILMGDVKKGELNYYILKLNLIILLCITEDHYANVLMHDSNLVFRVKIQSINNSGRYSASVLQTEPKPLANSILDLAVKFIGCHVKKLNTLVELVSQILSVVHRLLSYEKKSKTRIIYPWQDLWKVLMDLLESISKESNNPPQDYFALAYKAVTIFNLFITFGDTFLPSPSTYDELYYEITRRSDIFSKLYQKACTYSAKGGKFKENAVKVTNGLVNIRAITSHFKHIIEAWLKAEELSTPTPEETLEVVKSNYESLTLKLQEGLDQYEPYCEAPHHTDFFKSLMHSLIQDTWTNKIVLKELQSGVVHETFSNLNSKD
ncbi:armadillo-like helical domain-containing protein 3 [Lepeophtheirus salmonis]|uniref:armadillo-like helical domain-containing protein 3 n=1 Tax=Lepeophtheirus salmonis TaxID=72036 RepID=UPI001AE8A7E8|nr:armadillo-like helical domain-containing protein 3 [Lepeophtheirus salmonis]XP_040574123.1 armadillo-like helical domain-containing protein 3 [Lepeophtheirus salmonis]